MSLGKGYVPRIAVAVLILAAGLFFLSGQFGQLSAAPSTPQACYYYYYPYSSTYWYYYGYPYYQYYCNYGYYGGYYGYYGYAYDYYYGYYTQPKKYQLTVGTDPADLSTVSGGGTYTEGTSAAFSITQTVIQTSPNSRYVFSHWSGDYSGVGTSGSISMNGARKVVAVYQLQNYLSVDVQPATAASPQGEGWYNAGDTVTLTVSSEILGGEAGSRLVFQGWSVDGKTVQSGVTLTLKMDAPHSASAQYKTQYYLKVLTDQGVPYGEGWYDAGSTAEIYVSTPVSTNYGVSIVFNGWQGDLQSSSQSATVVMDKPKTVIASWGTDATMLNMTIALGIIAAFLAGAGILAYVAVTRKQFQKQELAKAPKKTMSGLGPESAAVEKKSVPLKKKALKQSADET